MIKTDYDVVVLSTTELLREAGQPSHAAPEHTLGLLRAKLLRHIAQGDRHFLVLDFPRSTTDLSQWCANA